MANSTISTFQIGLLWPTGWGTSGILKIISDRSFVAGGKPYPQGRQSDPVNQNFCYQAAITVANNVATVAAITLPQTDVGVTDIDGSGEPSYTGIIYSNAGRTKRQLLFQNWRIGESLTTTFNFAAWTAYNNAVTVINPQPRYLDEDEVNALITARLNAPATTDELGTVKVSTTPADVAEPTALEVGDPRVGAQYNFTATAYGGVGDCTGAGVGTNDRTALSTLVNTTLASGGGEVLLPGSLTGQRFYKIGSNLTIPANIRLNFAPGAAVYVPTGVTFKIVGDIAPTKEIIFLTAGTGVVSFSGNTTIREICPSWWGDSGSEATTTGSISSTVNPTQLTVALAAGYKIGQGIYVAGAGAAGVALIAKIIGILGTTFTLDTAASTTVSSALVQHDDTTATNAAVAAANTMLIGKIKPSYGIHNINGPLQGTALHQSMIPMPTVAFAGNQIRAIEIDGPSIPPATFGTVVTTVIPSTHACIYQTLRNSGAVFGGSNGTDFTAVALRMTNCIVRIPDNPSIIGIDGRLLGGLFLDYVVVDTNRYTTDVVQPTDTAQAGIAMPQIQNAADQTLGHVAVFGCYYGVSDADHTRGDYLILAGNYVGLGLQTSDHASYYSRILFTNNHVNVKVNGNHYFQIAQMDIEHATTITVPGLPAWQDSTGAGFYDVDDAGDAGQAEIAWHIIVANTGSVGAASEFKTRGGLNIRDHHLGFPHYACRVKTTTPTTLTTATETGISFETELEDDYSLHSTVTNPNRITVTRPGTYMLIGSADFAADAGALGGRYLNFSVNGSAAVPGTNLTSVGTALTRVNAVGEVTLTTGDYVGLLLTQTRGTDLVVSQALLTLERKQ